MRTKLQKIKDTTKLLGMTKDEIIEFLGKPDYSEFDGAQLIYIKNHGLFRNKLAIFIDFDLDGFVESVDKLYDIEIYKE